MAKSFNKSNVAITQQSGKVGNVRFYQRKGETYVRSAHNAVTTNPRTDKQMRQRLQFVSRAVIWRTLKGKLTNAFTTKAGNQSDYNIFTKLNNGKGVFFTKQQKAKGAQVIFPLQISEGSLPTIITSMNRGQLKTNIQLGNFPRSPLYFQISGTVRKAGSSYKEYTDRIAAFAADAFSLSFLNR